MRILLAAPLLLLAACEVTENDTNGTTTVEFNQVVAEEGARDAANKAGEIAGTIANDVEQSAQKVKNEVGDVNVDVDVNRNKSEPATNAN